MQENSDISFLTLIANRGKKDILIEALTELGCRMIHVEYGRGSVRSNVLMDIFGLVHEEKKAIIMTLLHTAKTDEVFKILDEKFEFNKANTGIAFTVPVSKLVF